MTLKCKNPYFDENIDKKFVFLLHIDLLAKAINLGEKFDGLFISDDKVGILETHLDYEMAVLKEVSVYEAFEHCIPDGMRYNKELDKLVPDVIEKQWTRENTGSNHFASDGTAFNTIEEALSHNDSLYFDSLWCKDVEEKNNQKENISCKNEKSKHYELWKDFEAIDVLKNCLTINEFIGFLKGNILKYQLRLGKKDDVSKEMIKIKDYQNELNYLLKELNAK